MENLRTNIVLINIFDHATKKFLRTNITMRTAAVILNTSYKNISFAKKRGSLIKGRYQIIEVGLAPRIETDDPEFVSYARLFTSQWEDAVKPFRILYLRKKKREEVR